MKSFPVVAIFCLMVSTMVYGTTTPPDNTNNGNCVKNGHKITQNSSNENPIKQEASQSNNSSKAKGLIELDAPYLTGSMSSLEWLYKRATADIETRKDCIIQRLNKIRGQSEVERDMVVNLVKTQLGR